MFPILHIFIYKQQIVNMGSSSYKILQKDTKLFETEI